jgi:hypothetical protein
MRQRLLMIFKPDLIAHVDIAAAHRAFPEVLGLGQSRSGDLPTDDDAARARFVEARDFHLMFRSKEIRPRIPPRPDLSSGGDNVADHAKAHDADDGPNPPG